MISYEPPKQKVVSIGEHIDGIGTVLDPDDDVMDSFLKQMNERRTEDEGNRRGDSKLHKLLH